MLLTTRAIVFHALKYRDTSLIVELYTERLGLRKYIVNGVRKANARISASLVQPMSLLEVVAYERPDRDLNRLKELRPAHVFQAIPFEVRKGAVGLFMTEVARKSILEREENTALFQFLYERFVGLDELQQGLANYHLQFMLDLSAHLGIIPAGEYDAETPIFDLLAGEFVTDIPEHHHYLIDSTAQALDQLLHHNWRSTGPPTIDRPTRQQLLGELIRYYQFHLEGMGEVNAHQVLKSIF